MWNQLNRKLLMLVALLAGAKMMTGCASVSTFHGPDGEVMFQAKCSETSDCFEKAHEICQGPYEVKREYESDHGTFTQGSADVQRTWNGAHASGRSLSTRITEQGVWFKCKKNNQQRAAEVDDHQHVRKRPQQRGDNK